MFKFEDPRYITVLVLLGFGGFVIRARFKKQTEIDWPLFFWILAIIFANAFEGFFNNNVLYAGLVASLILRFEFMPPKVAAFFRWVEIGLILFTWWVAMTAIGLNPLV